MHVSGRGGVGGGPGGELTIGTTKYKIRILTIIMIQREREREREREGGRTNNQSLCSFAHNQVLKNHAQIFDVLFSFRGFSLALNV